MLVLWQGLNAYFTVGADTATLRSLLTGGLHNLQAPEDVTYPYGTFQVVSANPDNHASAKRYVENCLIQFSLFSNQPSMTGLLAVMDQFVIAYDFCASLAVSGYTVLSCVRESTIQPERIDDVWQAIFEYRIKLKKN